MKSHSKLNDSVISPFLSGRFTPENLKRYYSVLKSSRDQLIMCNKNVCSIKKF